MTRQAPGATIGALISLVHGLRPDWDKPGIRTAVEAGYAAGHALGLVSAAAVDAAITASTKTPAGIEARLRDGWGSATHGWTRAAIDEQRAPLPHGQAYPRCGTCKREILGGETRETHVCRQRLDPNRAAKREALATMRVAAAQAATEIARLEAEARAREIASSRSRNGTRREHQHPARADR